MDMFLLLIIFDPCCVWLIRLKVKRRVAVFYACVWCVTRGELKNWYCHSSVFLSLQSFLLACMNCPAYDHYGAYKYYESPKLYSKLIIKLFIFVKIWSVTESLNKAKIFYFEYSRFCLLFHSFNVTLSPTDDLTALQNVLFNLSKLSVYEISGSGLYSTVDQYYSSSWQATVLSS